MTLSCRITPFRLALSRPVVTARGAIDERAGVIVALDDGEHVGLGEASPLPGWSTETPADVQSALAAVAETIAGQHMPAIDAALDSLTDRPHSRAALVGAWLDVGARRARLPLARWLAGGVSRRVAVNALVTGGGVDDVTASSLTAVRRGHRAVKLKVGVADPGHDVDRVRATRAAIGPDVELRLDANGAWDHDTAVEVLTAVERFDIAYCEEPVSGIEAIAAVGSACGGRMAVDESVGGVDDVDRALAAGIGVVVVKIQTLGGSDRALEIAQRTVDAGATPVVTTFLGSAVDVTQSLHLAAAMGGPAAHGLVTAHLLAADLAVAPPVEAGAMTLPGGPGLGIELR
ncbi:MAG: o-succinylbenzoate synthase [Acidimicrobiales bacterium]